MQSMGTRWKHSTLGIPHSPVILAAPTMAALTLDNLTKHFPGGVRAVEGLSLTVRDGELVVLAGPSGCGKTTTLRLIAGLESPTAGRITLGGRPLDGVPPRGRDVAMVFQSPALYPHLSVAGNLGFGLKLRGVAREEIRERVEWAAEMLGIGDLLARRPGELSGGQQQRVALGRAIVRKPKLFLFDEPLSDLDPALRAELRAEIRRLQARLGVTTLYVTHDQAEAMTLGQRIAVLRDGRLQQLAEPRTIYQKPANRFVAVMFGSPGMNLVEGRLESREGQIVFVAGSAAGEAWAEQGRAGASAEPGDAGFALPLAPCHRQKLRNRVGKPITLGVRPEHVLPAAECGPDTLRFPATVEAVEPIGPETHVRANAGGQPFVLRTAAAPGLHAGDRIDLGTAPESLLFLDSESGQRLE